MSHNCEIMFINLIEMELRSVITDEIIINASLIGF